MDAGSLDRRVGRADGEIVWSWHPDAGVTVAGDEPGSDGG
jgi:hypothetical protein